MNTTLEKISELLRQQIGLSVDSVGLNAFEHAIQIRMRSVAVSLFDDYWQSCMTLKNFKR